MLQLDDLLLRTAGRMLRQQRMLLQAQRNSGKLRNDPS